MDGRSESCWSVPSAGYVVIVQTAVVVVCGIGDGGKWKGGATWCREKCGVFKEKFSWNRSV